MSKTTFPSGTLVRAIDVKGTFFIGVYISPIKNIGHFVRNPKGQKVYCKKNHVYIAEAEEVTAYVRALTSAYKEKEANTSAQAHSTPLAAQNIDDL